MRLLAATMLFLPASCLMGAISCTTADYNGTFAFYSNGNLVTLPPAGAVLEGPFAQSGTFTSDGAGNVIIQATVSYNGLILPGGIPATYTITPDCVLTFALTLPFPLSVASTFKGQLSLDNRQTNLAITDPPGTLVAGEHYKQASRFCGIGDFSGAYQIDLHGAISAPKSLAGLYYLMGRLVADGAGGFTSANNINYNGNLVTESVTGTYVVNANCFVTLTYTSSAGSSSPQTITINGAISNQGQGDILPMMITTSGYAVAGLVRAQQQ